MAVVYTVQASSEASRQSVWESI